ncbi:ABC transporter ATP-binding protein [Phyllobacterium phragmitis]|uniref:ABC transporter ATP-binding protein n=1 Tax=Phyllobacterium phragmitis TaxID=2670329 RepID=A0A2S9ILQ8_9HYPH|nr:ATP-binding cassette domain-containing protein [Phyllobacterium phragmitis]PRD41464.1 ABC transporter ATP-binding protein [Phyllobacterium phragmitis]
MNINAGRNIETRHETPPIPALELMSVGHAYGARKALDAVSFTIAPGRFAVLLGLNGAGKTTLFSLISHLFATRSGQIRVFGHDISRKPGDALRRLGIVFQARTLDLDLTVRQNLSYHASLHGIGRRETRRRIETLMESIDMGDRLNDKARSLSGGQMRRVEIIRALLHRPSLLLLDEATVGLDVKSRATILADIRELVRKDGISVLWATHLIDEVSDADQVIILHKGRLMADGRVEDVVAATGARTINDAFARLTGSQPPSPPPVQEEQP